MAQATMGNTGGAPPYPVQYSVEYPESSSRLKALFRLILVIPIAVIYILVSGINGALFPAVLLMLLFRKKLSAVVVRRKPRGGKVHGEMWGVPLPPPGRVPLNRRTAGRPAGHRISRCPNRPEPGAAAHQMAAGGASLDHHLGPLVRLRDRGGHFVDCHHHHREAPAPAVRFPGRLRPVGIQDDFIRDPADDG